jgi:hypothetical protein
LKEKVRELEEKLADVAALQNALEELAEKRKKNNSELELTVS